MNTKLELVKKYGDAFRDLINTMIAPTNADIRKTLRLSKEEDWAFLCIAIDILEDTCTAINSFLMFGLNGSTKYDDIGERYLRLYGILSATYIQQEAMLKLCQLCNISPSLKEVRRMVDTLLIRSLRHKLCSHSTNYLDRENNSIQAYVPIRIDLDNFNCTYAKNGGVPHHSVDLKAAVDDHLSLIIELLDKVTEKAIKTLFKGQESNKNCIKFSKILDELRMHAESSKKKVSHPL